MKRFAVLIGLVLVSFALPLAAQVKYGATVTADKATDFTKLKTYVWQSGWDANDKSVHAQIVSAVDKELKALGFELKASGPSDVIVKYASLRRIDVEADVKGDATTPRRQLDVGSLIVVMIDPATKKELLRGRVDKPMEIDPAQMPATITSFVADLFAKYPTRIKK
jgi:hypothetical protein